MIGRVQVIGLLFALALPSSAQLFPGKVATVSATVKPGQAAHGSKGVLLITLNIGPQYHVNAHKLSDRDLIPTTFTANPTAGVTFGAPVFPRGETIHVSYQKQPMSVYQGKAIVQVPFTVTKSAKPGRVTLSGTLGYQGCNSVSCLPPVQAPITAALTIK